MLSRLKTNAQATGLLFDESYCFDRYVEFFSQLLRAEPGNNVGKRSDLGQAKGDREILQPPPIRGSFGETVERADIGARTQQISLLLEQKAADICDLHLEVQRLTHKYQLAVRDLHKQAEQNRKLEQDPSVRIIRKIRSLITARRNSNTPGSPIN